MADRDGYPAGVPCWVDSGRVSARAAKDFYGGLFGWEFENRSPEGFPPYFGAQLGGRDVAAIGEQAEQLNPPVWNTYVWVENADATAAKAVAAGGRVEMAPVDAGQAGRFAALSDPTGAGFCVWQADQHRGAVAVNEPGAWVSSELNTPDVETAMAFYGALFGWEADDPSEEGHATIRKPGYGDYLEELTPGLRKMHADVGAPKDFADVVGWLTPITDSTPAHWSVTFSVADADATAARAEELGGEVVKPVVASEWSRDGVLADPDGAVFTIGQFTPPE